MTGVSSGIELLQHNFLLKNIGHKCKDAVWICILQNHFKVKFYLAIKIHLFVYFGFI